MDNKQLAISYATAKVLGYEKSIDDFEHEVSKIYDETISKLTSRPVKLAETAATENPFRRSMY